MSSTIIGLFVFIAILMVAILLPIVIKRNLAHIKTINPIVSPPAEKEKEPEPIKVSLLTDKGEIVLSLRPDLMPNTVENFIRLVNSGFYNGLTFHRSEIWVIQGGDPTGTGKGGPGWTIKLEISRTLKHVKYAVAMARLKDRDSAGSQFYILKKDVASLNGKYAVFGNVVKGRHVVDSIKVGDIIREAKVV